MPAAKLYKPQGKLTYHDPNHYGYLEKLPRHRDWRPARSWQGTSVEYIDPLGAIGPAGDVRPTDMSSTWTIDTTRNQALRWATASGNPPVAGLSFYDGNVYASSVSPLTWGGHFYSTAALHPNLALRLTRYTPPPSQGVIPQTTLQFSAYLKASVDGTGAYRLDDDNGTWYTGLVFLVLPFGCPTYPAPLLRWALTDTNGIQVTRSDLLDTGPAQTVGGNDVSRELWLFEYVEDPSMTTFVGGHILIRNDLTGSNWWHVRNPCVRLLTGVVHCSLGGCRQELNLSRILYSDSLPNEQTTWADRGHMLPSLQWNDTVAWDCLHTYKYTSNDWTVTLWAKDSDLDSLEHGFRPLVTFTPFETGLSYRPVLWLVHEDHPAVITSPTAQVTYDTDGDGLLYALTLSMDATWQRTTCSAEFNRTTSEAYSAWKEGGWVTVNLGWQDDPTPSSEEGEPWSTRDIETLNILPGGIERGRVGEEYIRCGLRLTMGDFIATRMEHSDIVDQRQAAGSTVTDWAHRIGHALGLPDSLISVDTEVAATVIPFAEEVPSRPHLWPQDGASWAQHVDEVCNVLGIRWGWHNALFFDTGTPAYVVGATPSFTLDYDTLTAEDRVLEIRHVQDGSEYRTGIKVVWGPEARLSEGYWLKEPAVREADGWVSWGYEDNIEAAGLTATLAKLSKRHQRAESVIEWTGPLRPGLLPDQFVKVGDCPDLGLETNAVYQVTEVTHRTDLPSMAASSDVKAVRVYSPAEATAAPEPALNASLGAGDL